MTQIAIINDTHIGGRGDSLSFFQYFDLFYDRIFFPYLEQHNINTVYHLGDLVDRRKYINIQTLNNLKIKVLDRLVGKEVHILAGNHDVYHKNTNRVNALSELVSPYGFNIYLEPTEVGDHLFLPWINQENQEKSLEMIRNTKCHTAFGHLEIKGFEMMRGNVADQGLDKDLFSKFDKVFSGHFHQKSQKGNIYYLGAPYEMTWADYAENRGFHVYDTDTHKIEFIKNPYRMFFKVEYDDSKYDSLESLLDRNFDEYSGTYVKIMVHKKNNPYWFDLFFDKLEAAGPNDIRIIEGIDPAMDQDLLQFNSDGITDTFTILTDYTKRLGLVDTQHKKLDSLLRTIYDEALVVRDSI